MLAVGIAFNIQPLGLLLFGGLQRLIAGPFAFGGATFNMYLTIKRSPTKGKGPAYEV